MKKILSRIIPSFLTGYFADIWCIQKFGRTSKFMFEGKLLERKMLSELIPNNKEKFETGIYRLVIEDGTNIDFVRDEAITNTLKQVDEKTDVFKREVLGKNGEVVKTVYIPSTIHNIMLEDKGNNETI